MTTLIAFLIGLLMGFYGYTTLNYIKNIYETVKEAREYKNAGVVRPGVTPVTKNTNQPIDLSTETGGVRRPTPEQYAIANLKERERRLRENV